MPPCPSQGGRIGDHDLDAWRRRGRRREAKPNRPELSTGKTIRPSPGLDQTEAWRLSWVMIEFNLVCLAALSWLALLLSSSAKRTKSPTTPPLGTGIERVRKSLQANLPHGSRHSQGPNQEFFRSKDCRGHGLG